MIIKSGLSASCPIIIGLSCYSPEKTLLQKLKEREDTLGGCKLWLSQSYEDRTGWFLEEAIGSELEKGSINKLERLLRNLGPRAQWYPKYKESCRKNPNKRIILTWNDSQNWHLEVRDWNNQFKKAS